MVETIKEALIVTMFYISTLIIVPVVTHKILYMFAKITYKMHIKKLNKNK